MENLIKDQNPTGEQIVDAVKDKISKLPPSLFFYSALGIIGVSVALKVLGKNAQSSFVGKCAAPLLVLGIYNKLQEHKKSNEDEVEKEKKEKQ